MLNVKYSMSTGCVFLGKGIKDHPEMGVIIEARTVIFDEFDVMTQEWKGHERGTVMYRTDNGYAFDDAVFEDGIYEIDLYAPNWRAHKGTPWK